jgi:hypothetical protein
MIEVKKPDRAIPLWASVLIIVACLAGGAWLVWAFVIGGGTGDRIVVLDHAPGDGVSKTARDAWRIKAGTAGAQVTQKEGGGYDVDFFFERYEFLAPEEVDVLSRIRRITRDKSVATALQVTPAQMQQLQDIRAKAKLVMPDAERQQIVDHFPAYLQAEAAAEQARSALNRAEAAARQAARGPEKDRQSADNAVTAARDESERLESARRKASVPLIKAVEQTAQKLLPGAKQSGSQRAALAKSVLSADQWKKFDQMGG